MLDCVNVKNLSDTELLGNLDLLRVKERKITVDLILHLAEVEERKLHLIAGYGSMFEYVTKHLGFEESSASRRIRSARAVREYPEVLGYLADGRIAVTILALIAGVLTAENVGWLLDAVANRSRSEVELILSGLTVKASIPKERVRVLKVDKKCNGFNSHSDCNFQENLFQAEPSRSAEVEERYQYSFSGSAEFNRKVEELRMLLSSRSPGGVSLEQVFEAAVEGLLEELSPVRREARREKRRQRQDRKMAAPVSEESKVNRRRGGAATRDFVFVRDEGCCSYVSPDGRRCNSRWNLEQDHVQPFAFGGSSDASNLRMYCSKHNRLKADEDFGKAWMSRFQAG